MITRPSLSTDIFQNHLEFLYWKSEGLEIQLWFLTSLPEAALSPFSSHQVIYYKADTYSFCCCCFSLTCNVPNPKQHQQDPRRRRCLRLNLPPKPSSYFRCIFLRRGCERQRRKSPGRSPSSSRTPSGHGRERSVPISPPWSGQASPSRSQRKPRSSRAGSTDHCLPLVSAPEPPAFVPAPGKLPDEFFQLSIGEESGSVL